MLNKYLENNYIKKCRKIAQKYILECLYYLDAVTYFYKNKLEIYEKYDSFPYKMYKADYFQKIYIKNKPSTAIFNYTILLSDEIKNVTRKNNCNECKKMYSIY